MTYQEEDFLQLSGLQHFKFCRRQWALIHVEDQWEENYRTVEGDILHQRAHDEDLRESRGDLLAVRGVRVFSRTLGVSGAGVSPGGDGHPAPRKRGTVAALPGGV